MERWRQALSLRIFDLVPHRHRCIHSTAGLLTTNGQWTANRMRCTHHEARIGTATCAPVDGRHPRRHGRGQRGSFRGQVHAAVVVLGRGGGREAYWPRAIATPNRVTAHPGEVLNEEFLKPLGMSVNALAIALRIPATRIGAIVKGERAVTADTALRLARFYGTSPEFWMNLQAMHDLTKARMESGEAIARDVRPRAA